MWACRGVASDMRSNKPALQRMLLLTGDLIFACKQTGIQLKSRYPRIKGCLVRQMGRGVAERLPVRRRGLQSQTGLAVDGAFEAVGVLEE